MGNRAPATPEPCEEEQRAVLDFDVSVDAICRKLQELERAKEASVVVLAGAGISVSAGIPDFRTPGTGLYSNLQKYDLPSPESIFDIAYFREKPQAFCTLCTEMWPDNFAPTPAHFFIKLLEQKGILKRCFTQNIDTLERSAGVSPEKLVEAHGSFGEAHCIECKQEHPQAWLRAELLAGRVPTCGCGGLVKPDIVFFGESLPEKFFERSKTDLPGAKVLIVMGTSLQVTPFCELPHAAGPGCARLLLNFDIVGARGSRKVTPGQGFRFDSVDNYRDAALLGPCDDAVRACCDRLGWRADLDALVTADRQARAARAAAVPAAVASTGPDAAVAAPTAAVEPVPAVGAADAMAAALARNWRKPPPVLPPLRPFDDAAAATGAACALTCALVEPLSLAEVVGGRPAYFRVGLHGAAMSGGGTLAERQGNQLDYLGLYPAGASNTGERTDRDAPFRDGALAADALAEEIADLAAACDAARAARAALCTAAVVADGDGAFDLAAAPALPALGASEVEQAAGAAPADPAEAEAADPAAGAAAAAAEAEAAVAAADAALAAAIAAPRHGVGSPPFLARPLRLRVPWVRLPLPYDLEVWYVDGARDEVLARWGPLTLHANAPEDPAEETHTRAPGNGLQGLSAAELAKLMQALSGEFGMPEAMIKAMLQQQMGGGEDAEDAEKGGDVEDVEDEGGAEGADGADGVETAEGGGGGEDGEGGEGIKAAATGKTGLAAGFAAFKNAARGLAAPAVAAPGDAGSTAD